MSEDWVPPGAVPIEEEDWVPPGAVPVATEGNPGPAPEQQSNGREGPTQHGAGFRAFVGGALQNFADEAAGKTYEAGNYVRNLVNGVGEQEAAGRRTEDYRHGRDTTRQVLEEDRKAFPKTTFGAGVAGDVASQSALALGSGGATLSPAALALGMGVTSGVAGLGASDADLTKGEYGRAALDTGGGAAAGYAFGRAGQAVSGLAKPGAVRGFLAKKVGAAEGDAFLGNKKVREEALRSGLGAVGGETTAGRHGIEIAREILSSPDARPDQIELAKKILADPKTAELAREVYDSALERLPSRLGAIQQARSALGPLRDATSPTAVTAATEETLKHPVRPFVNFAKNYGLRATGAGVGTYLGSSMDDGGALGPAAGAVAGAFVGAAMGNPTTALAKAMVRPEVRRAWWRMFEMGARAGGAGLDALGKFGPYLAREYQRNPEHARALDEALSTENPEYAAKKAAMLQGSVP